MKSVKPKFAKILRPLLEKEYFDDEVLHGLPGTQQWLDYTLACEAIKKELRFGIRKKMPEKPLIQFSSELSNLKYFSCPSEACRGFVTTKLDGSLRCGLCQNFVCTTCRDILVKDHVCKKEVLETLKALQQESKECPTCGVHILRSQGCNHMFCTHCGNHFDWATGLSIASRTSTNHHQKDTKTWSKVHTQECDENVMTDSVPSIAFQDSDVVQTLAQNYLQNDIAVVRHLQKTKYQNRLAKHIEELMNLRVKYLRTQIDKETFQSKLFSLNETQKQKDSDGIFLETLLLVLKDLQVYLQDAVDDKKDHHITWCLRRLCENTQTSFQFQFTNRDLCFLIS